MLYACFCCFVRIYVLLAVYSLLSGVVFSWVVAVAVVFICFAFVYACLFAVCCLLFDGLNVLC